MTRPCPAQCGRDIPGADILCKPCLNRVSHPTRSALADAWRRFNKAGRVGDMRDYQAVVDRAIREARLVNGAGRLPDSGVAG